MALDVTKLWVHPDIQSTKVDAFRRWVNTKYGLQLENYHDLWEWSIEALNDFWMSIWVFTQVKATVQPRFAVSPRDTKTMFPPISWFPEARLNFTQNMLESPFASISADFPVVVGIREEHHDIEHLTLSVLKGRVGQLSNALRRAGIQPLDRVACIGSNSITTLVVFLATASTGAVFTCCSPELGVKAILDRLLQVRPKIMFADDWVLYNGKKTSCLDKIAAVSTRLRKEAYLETVVVIPRFRNLVDHARPNASCAFDFFTKDAATEISYNQVPFSHPLVIVYSSGTTGQPKCLVHSCGGVLLKQKTEQILSVDMGPGSILLQYSSTNWIMYLYSVSGLLSGAKSILYDGSPMFPSTDSLLDIVSAHKVTHFGTSAHYLSVLQASGLSKSNMGALPALKCITSTGSVLTEPQFHWCYQTFGPVQLSSIAGGTDIAGAFVGGSPDLPVFAGWCQARVLGMKVQIFSDDGISIESSGQAGELVCTAPFPSQPQSFWGDSDNARYKDAYFAKFPGFWHQGDYIRMDPATRGVQFLGRSDGVLNPSGVRFGSAEIYNALDDFDDIEDCLCVGQRRPQDSDENVLLFVKMKNAHRLDHILEAKIKERITRDLSKRHVPKHIFETPDIPMTINGKKAELPVKKIVNGQTVVASSTIANPHALEWYAKFAKLPFGSNFQIGHVKL